MQHLEKTNFKSAIKEFIESGRPFLGICTGLHLLFDSSEESPDIAGLGIIPGKVLRFCGEKMVGLKIPHMGWNQLAFQRSAPIFDGIPDGSHFYFDHSYYVEPTDTSFAAAETDYGASFCSVVWRENLFATQFPPANQK